MENRLIDRLLHAMPKGVESVELPPEVNHCELMVHTQAGYAFFHIVNPQEDVVSAWRDVQDEIAKFIRRLSHEGNHEGAYLALLVEGEHDSVKMQRIASNPYVCRKIVVPRADQVDLQALVRQMPFFPLPDSVDKVVRRPPVNPLLAAHGTGISAAFVASLLDWKAPATVKAELLQNTFSVTEETVPAPIQPEDNRTTGRRPDRYFVRRLTLKGFRNYGAAREPVELPGNLIVIYGRNGTGKTTLCEGIEWAITGQSHRINRSRAHEQGTVDHTPLFNLKDADLPVVVDVVLEGTDRLELGRQLNRGADKSIVNLNGAIATERELLERLSLLVDDEEIPRMNQLVQEVMRSCHFLSQETIQGFLFSGPEERYKAYRLMAATQHLDRLTTKGDEVVRLLGQDISQQRARFEQLNSQVEDRTSEQKRKLTQVEAALLIELPQLEDTLLAHAEDVSTAAQSLGVTIKLPKLPPGSAARVVAETFLSRYSARVEAVQQQVGQLSELSDEALEAERKYGQRDREERQLTGLTAELDQRTNELERLEDDAERIRTAVETRQDDLNDVRTQLMLVQRDLSTQARRAELQGQIGAQVVQRNELLGQYKQLKAVTAKHVRTVAGMESSIQGSHDHRSKLEDELSELGWIAGKLPRWRTLAFDLDTILEETQRLDKSEVVLSKKIQKQQAVLERATEGLRSRYSVLDTVQRVTEEREQLLVALRGHLRHDENNCPFCGADHGHNELLSRAEAIVAKLPTELQRAQQEYDRAKRVAEDSRHTVDRWDAQLQQVGERRVELEQRRNPIVRELSDANTKVISVFGQPLAQLDDAQLVQRHESAHSQVRTVEDQATALQAALMNAQEELAVARTEEGACRQQIDASTNLLGELQRELQQLVSVAGSGPNTGGNPATREQSLRKREQDSAATLARDQARLAKAQGLVDTAITALRGLQARKGGVSQDVDRTSEWIRQYEANLTRWSISAPTPAAQRMALERSKVRFKKELEKLQALAASAERLLAEVHAFGLLLEVQHIDDEVKSFSKEMGHTEEALSSLSHHRESVERVLQQARNLMVEEEQERLQFFQPMIQLLYHRLNAHPYFGDLDLDLNSEERSLFIRFCTGHDQLVETAAVNQYFSMAQANAVALSIFLGTAMLQAWSRLGVICLDDPIQHMDDINTYALVDLLYVISNSGRQVIITTSNEDFYQLMLSRFGALNTADQTHFQAFRLVGITAEGPEVFEDTPKPLQAAPVE